MADDVYILTFDGYEAGRETFNIVEETENKKGEKKVKIKGWEGKLIPKALIECTYFAKERAAIDTAQAVVEETQSQLDEMVEEETAEGGFLFDYLDEDKGTIDTKKVNAALKLMKKTTPDSEEYQNLHRYAVLVDKVKEFNKLIKEISREKGI